MFTLEEKIGQMFIIRMYGKKVTKELELLIKKYKIGGIILYSNNYDSYEEMIDLINELKKINKKYNKIPLFISTDHEGGRVNRLPINIEKMKSAKLLKSKNDINIVKNSAKIIGQLLKQSGFSINFAPVLDIQRFKDNHAIGDRCFGCNKEDVIKYGIEYMNELKKEKIISCVKHFPGHGLTCTDSHFLVPIVKEKYSKFVNEDLVPFKKAIKNNVPMIMIGHLYIPDIDKKYPATLSKKVNNILRKDLKYDGVIVTDDIKMKSVKLFHSYYSITKKAIDAGNDIIMVGTTYNKIQQVIEKIIKNSENNKVKTNRIDESFDRIINLKKEYNINDNKVKKINIDLYNKKIKELNNKLEGE